MCFHPNQSGPLVALKRLSVIRYIESWYRFRLLLYTWIAAIDAEACKILCHYFVLSLSRPSLSFYYLATSISYFPSSDPLYWFRKKWIVKRVNHFSSLSLVFIYQAGRSISSREKKVELVMTSTLEDDSCLSSILVYQILAYHTSQRTPC